MLRRPLQQRHAVDRFLLARIPMMNRSLALTLLLLPLMSCVSQMKRGDTQSFYGVGVGTVEDSFGLHIQGGDYREDPMLGSNSLGIYAGLGGSNIAIQETETSYSVGQPIGEEIATLWGSLGATFRLSESIGLRAGVTIANVRTYGVYIDPFDFEEINLEEGSETRVGAEFGFDFLPSMDSKRSVVAGATYSSVLDAVLVNLSWIQ